MGRRGCGKEEKQNIYWLQMLLNCIWVMWRTISINRNYANENRSSGTDKWMLRKTKRKKKKENPSFDCICTDWWAGANQLKWNLLLCLFGRIHWCKWKQYSQKYKFRSIVYRNPVHFTAFFSLVQKSISWIFQFRWTWLNARNEKFRKEITIQRNCTPKTSTDDIVDDKSSIALCASGNK